VFVQRSPRALSAHPEGGASSSGATGAPRRVAETSTLGRPHRRVLRRTRDRIVRALGAGDGAASARP